MFCDLPFYKRCCFCLPLRLSLIMWMYIKMIGVIALLVVVSIILNEDSSTSASSHTACHIILSLAIQLLILDELFSFTFLLAEQKKNSKLMWICYYYNIFLLVASDFVMILLISFTDVFFPASGRVNVEEFLLSLIIILVNSVSQIYIILLVRSEAMNMSYDACVSYNNDSDNVYCTIRENMNMGVPHLPIYPELKQVTNEAQRTFHRVPVNGYPDMTRNINNMGVQHLRLHQDLKQLANDKQGTVNNVPVNDYCDMTRHINNVNVPYLGLHPELKQLLNDLQGTKNNVPVNDYCEMRRNINNMGVQHPSQHQKQPHSNQMDENIYNSGHGVPTSE